MIEVDDHGIGDKQAAYARAVSELGLRLEFSALLFGYLVTAYDSCLDPFPEVLPTLRWLRERVPSLGSSPTARAAQEPGIAGLGLVPLMDTVLISEPEGVRKPDASARVPEAHEENAFLNLHAAPPLHRLDESRYEKTHQAGWPMTSAISNAISSTVCVDVLRASLSANDGLYFMTSAFEQTQTSSDCPKQFLRWLARLLQCPIRSHARGSESRCRREKCSEGARVA